VIMGSRQRWSVMPDARRRADLVPMFPTRSAWSRRTRHFRNGCFDYAGRPAIRVIRLIHRGCRRCGPHLPGMVARLRRCRFESSFPVPSWRGWTVWTAAVHPRRLPPGGAGGPRCRVRRCAARCCWAVRILAVSYPAAAQPDRRLFQRTAGRSRSGQGKCGALKDRQVKFKPSSSKEQDGAVGPDIRRSICSSLPEEHNELRPAIRGFGGKRSPLHARGPSTRKPRFSFPRRRCRPLNASSRFNARFTFRGVTAAGGGTR